jgi:anthranilate phosphoribosyltransferase
MLKEFIQKVVAGQHLTEEESSRAMGAIMEGTVGDAQIAALAIALRMKGETVDEITGFARAMRARAVKVAAPPDVIDTCGTGGDRSGTFNVSTAAALVAAGAGARVAKHGNRSVSSHSGSADVFKALGVNTEAPLPVVEQCIREAGIGFLFAPAMHPAMKHVVNARREMGVRTVFNILGPLTNPAGAMRQIVGVFDAAYVETMARVLHRLGTRRSFVVHGEDGLDEISTCAPSLVCEVCAGTVRTYSVSPQDFGIPQANRADLRVSDAEGSAAAIRGLLAGERGPRRDIAMLNAACALVAAGVAEDMPAGLVLAERSIDSGAARRCLDRLAALSNGRG